MAGAAASNLIRHMMNYQVLARKYRPRTFDQMVGQEHVLRALINALDQERLHHAYLFTGTRGVGKTTLARLLAKCLNCELGISSKPCNNCNSCQEINEGRFVDLIEVDAASRTKVEDTRELLENVQYAPTRGRYKVYLIDEVHMLSGHSFNALLKTLEEPPPHIKFLLATTDPQRLPITVLSRCLQFNLKNLPAEQIKTQLINILGKENIQHESIAIALLAKAAHGSLRDALSLLDQAIAYGGGQVITAEVRAMLGTIEQTHIIEILEKLANQDAQGLIEEVNQLAEHATDFQQALEELLSLLHQVALIQAIPGTITEENAKISQLAQQISKEDIQLYYQIGLIGRRDLPLAPSNRSGFEMVLLRMLAFKPATPTTKAAQPTNTQTESTKPQQNQNKNNINTDWSSLVSQLNLAGFALALANHCALIKFDGNHFQLALDPNQTALYNAKQETRIAEALSAHFGKPITLQIQVSTAKLATPARINQQQQTEQLQSATQKLTTDPNLQKILQTFDAKIQTDSIQLKEKT